LLTRETLAVMLPVAVTLLEAVSEEVADVVAVELTDCKGRRGERWPWTGVKRSGEKRSLCCQEMRGYPAGATSLTSCSTVGSFEYSSTQASSGHAWQACEVEERGGVIALTLVDVTELVLVRVEVLLPVPVDVREPVCRQ